MNRQAIFLSASIPQPDRPPYFKYCDKSLIRDAVRALVVVIVRQQRTLVFGGHPAISPLVEHTAASLQAIDRIRVYQSEFFRKVIPDVAMKLPLRWTAAAASRVESLTAMRREMITSHPFAAGVFVGGMEGIFEEASLFRESWPQAAFLPLASTGGATLNVFHQYAMFLDRGLSDELERNTDYESLLDQQLAMLP